MKLVSTDIPHKSEIGGVLLGVADEAAARQGYDTLIARANTARLDAKVDSVVVAPMISGSVETILGVKVDPAFGPVSPTGNKVAGDYVYVMEFDGDKIRHMTKIWNDGQTLRQLGWA